MPGTENTSVEVSIVLPVYNEAENIAPLISRLKVAVPSCEIVVVDDDSSDRTWEIAQNSGARVIRRMDERGLASALWKGIKSSNGRTVVWMDADLSMPPEDVPGLVKAINAGADIAVGSRYAEGGCDKRPFIRTFTSRCINIFANMMLPVKVKDYDSGFVALRKSVFDSVPIQAEGHGEYCIEFLCMAGLRGFKIVEVGYVFTDRVMGESKSAGGMISFLTLGLNYVKRVLAVRAKCKNIKETGAA